MGNDDAKRLILARRARFVAAALAGVAVACGGSTQDADPQPCLSPPSQPRDAGSDADAGPRVCLEAPLEDAGSDEDAGADADAEPQPCLKINPDAGDGG